MASVSPIHLHGSLQLNATHRNSFHGGCLRKSLIYSAYISSKFQRQHLNCYGGWSDNLRMAKPTYKFLATSLTTNFLIHSWRHASSFILSEIPLDYDFDENMPPLCVFSDLGIDTSYLYYLHHILCESARMISVGLKNQESSRNCPKLANAWIGVDVNAWHRRIAFQAAVYALLKAVLAIGELLVDNHSVNDILSPKIQLIVQSLDEELSKRDPKLVEWFKMEQLPALTKCVTAVVEKSTSHYVESGSEVSILAVGCCVAIKKLDPACISCPAFTGTLQDIIWEVLEASPDFSSDVLHQISTKLGVEREFLACFGSKILHPHSRGNMIFWIGLLQEKLVAALSRESVVTILRFFCRSEVLSRDLAVIGLFAFLGRKTRLFLAQMGIKDLDENVEDFICYLECGILFLYPELSSVCVYQLFMDVVTEEIGWLDLYATEPYSNIQEKKWLKQQPIQAEKEIILSTVFGVCSTALSSFAHYTDKTKQSPSPSVRAYVHIIGDLLTFCLEDYWSVYDKLREYRETVRVTFAEPEMRTANLREVIASYPQKQRHQTHEDQKTNATTEYTPEGKQHKSKHNCADMILEMLPEAAETQHRQSFFAKSGSSLLSATSDICMGTSLLFFDVGVTSRLILKHICGGTLTRREKKKIVRTLIDLACVVPITILMLLPVTAIGHAAMLTAIKRYIPCLIPSPYSAERLDVLRQLKRAKRMKSWTSCSPGAVSVAG